MLGIDFMKVVLIIGYLWPCCRHQRGSLRTLGLAIDMMDYWWRQIILTAALNIKPDLPSEVRLLETPNQDFFIFGKGCLAYLVSTQAKV